MHDLLTLITFPTKYYFGKPSAKLPKHIHTLKYYQLPKCHQYKYMDNLYQVIKEVEEWSDTHTYICVYIYVYVYVYVCIYIYIYIQQSY